MMSTKDFSSVQERTIAEYLGWKVVTGSGSRAGCPGDITSDSWLGECKTHVNSGKKISFNRSVWNKISCEAASKFKYPVLFVDDGSQSISRTWCLFPYKVISDPGYCVVDIDLEVRANIVFQHSQMLEMYNSLRRKHDPNEIILSVPFCDTYLGIVPLEVFRQMFGE